MAKPKQASLDMQSLRLLLAIYESGSVTGAAEILEINQSSASQGLDKLRRIFGDPLFVKAGRGIAPTDRVELIVPRARRALSEMTTLLESADFDPSLDDRPFVVATNSYLRAELCQEFFVRSKGKSPSLKLIEVGHRRNIEPLLTHNTADIVIAIGKANYSDNIVSRKLYDDQMVCYYDDRIRSAPDTMDSFCSALHAVVDFGTADDSVADLSLKHYRKSREIALRVPTIEALPRLMKGTPLITTMPNRFAGTLFFDFEFCEPPIAIPSYSVDLVWHATAQHSGRSRWLRNLILSLVEAEP